MKAEPQTSTTEPSPVRIRNPDSPRERTRQRTRASLVDAAIRSFAERGYAGTTVERIVEAAGTTAPTFYRYFTGKSDLLDPLQDHIGTEVWRVLQELNRKDPCSLKEIRAWVWSYQAMWTELRQLCAAYWEAVASDPVFARGVMPRLLSSTSGMSEILASVAPERREKMRLRLAMLIVLLDRTVHLAGADADAARAAKMIDEFADILWLSLYSNEARAQMSAEV